MQKSLTLKQLYEKKQKLTNKYNMSGDYSLNSQLRDIQSKIDSLEGTAIKTTKLVLKKQNKPQTISEACSALSDVIWVEESALIEEGEHVC